MWNTDPQQRLSEWKAFRQSLDSHTAESALEQICAWWSFVPFVEHYLDRILASRWPGPWELIHHGQICDQARALGMLYTWVLTAHAKHYSSELRQYFDHSEGQKVNCFCVDPGGYVLNLEFNTVLKKHSFNRGFELIHTYPANKIIEI